jgi:hypothetical protein
MSHHASPEQYAFLDKLFREGKSVREAAKLAGVNKNTALRLRNGGMDAYRKQGAIFKQNRWR